MNFTFDNDRPIYIQLVEQLEIMIISGTIPLGSKLPSVRELAVLASVNPNTVQKALSELENKKMIYTERTNGKFVTKDIKLLNDFKKEVANLNVQKFFQDMENLGFTKEETFAYLQKFGGL